MNPADGEVGQPERLPDFVEPVDLGETSLAAAAIWGQEQVSPPPGSRADGVAPARGGGANGNRALAKRRATDEAPKPSRAKRSKKTLTWAEKQERRQKRAEERRAQEEAERTRDPMGFAREIVLTQLTAAPKSRAQLAEKLRAKEVDEDVIDAVLDRMEDVGLVDDAAFAGMVVRSQMASRGLARRALAQELSRKGIDAEVAQDALSQVDDAAERQRATELARKKLATMSRLDEQTQTRRLVGMLARKGYPPGLVWSVVKEVQGSFDSPGEF